MCALSSPEIYAQRQCVISPTALYCRSIKTLCINPTKVPSASTGGAEGRDQTSLFGRAGNTVVSIPPSMIQRRSVSSACRASKSAVSFRLSSQRLMRLSDLKLPYFILGEIHRLLGEDHSKEENEKGSWVEIWANGSVEMPIKCPPSGAVTAIKYIYMCRSSTKC